MKINKIIFLLTASISIVSTAIAESIDIRVVGTITPAACKPILTGGGIIDYGTIRPNSLKKDAYTVLDEKSLDISINCDAPAKVALKAVNGRPNTVAGANNDSPGGSAQSPALIFGRLNTPVVGLGLDGSKRIGGYGIRFSNNAITVDGKSADNIHKDGSAAGWNTSSSSPSSSSLFSSEVRNQSWAKPGTLEPIAFTTLNGKLGVQAYINKASELDLTKPVKLDGLTTLELVYL